MLIEKQMNRDMKSVLTVSQLNVRKHWEQSLSDLIGGSLALSSLCLGKDS